MSAFEAPTTLAVNARIRSLQLLAAMLALGAALAYFVDLPVAAWAQQRGSHGEFGKTIRFSEAFAHGSGVVLIVMAAMAIDPRQWRVVPRLLCGAFGAGLIANLMKITVGRTRPSVFDAAIGMDHTFLGMFLWRHAATLSEGFSRDIQSFPSGHAATAAGLACALSRLYPRGSWCFALLTVFAGFQRIEANAHFLSDVLAGAAVGTFVALVLEARPLRQWFEALEVAASEPNRLQGMITQTSAARKIAA